MSDDLDLDEALQALRDAQRRRDAFLAILARELGNHLAVIRNAIRIQKSTNPEADRVSVLEAHVADLTRLAEDLKDASRLADGRIQLQRSGVHLGDVIRAAVQSVEPSMEASPHHLAVNMADEPVVVDGDPSRLTQIFANLLSNAIKYTPLGGRVRLSAERIERDVIVRVSDDGKGIPPEHLPHVFEMFYAKETVFGMADGGLGVGLAIARHLVELHGGTVDARSDGPGKGSEFTVRLPLAAESPTPAPPR